jgi:hypothetical protein
MQVQHLYRRVGAIVLAFCLSLLATWTPLHVVQAAEFSCAGVSEISGGECSALVALYENTAGANWLDRTNWLVTNTPCDWQGVICDEGHVVELYLPANNLSGVLPAQLAELTQLAFLDVSANQLKGALPANLSGLANLEELYVQANTELSGDIPNEYTALQALDLLWYGQTTLCGVNELVRASIDAEEEIVLPAQLSAMDGWLMGLDSLQSTDLSCSSPTLELRLFLPAVLNQ